MIPPLSINCRLLRLLIGAHYLSTGKHMPLHRLQHLRRPAQTIKRDIQSIQLVIIAMPPDRWSGSAIPHLFPISTRLWVPSGTSSHDRGGEMSFPSQVYFKGISPPSANAVDVIFIVPSTFDFPAAGTAHPNSRTAPMNKLPIDLKPGCFASVIINSPSAHSLLSTREAASPIQ